MVMSQAPAGLAGDPQLTPLYLVSLVTADVADQPCAVRLLALPPARPGDPFRITDGTLRLGHATIPLRDGVRWQPASLTALELTLRREHTGLWDRLAVVRSSAERCCAQVITALAPFTQPDRYSSSWVRRLVGLGPGLTPSGDDLLVGAILATRLAGAAVGPGPARGLPGRVLDAASRTSDVSAHLLRLAAHGHFSGPLLGLAGALIHPAQDLPAALDTTLSVGASSGADVAYGLAAALADLLPRLRRPEGWRRFESMKGNRA